MKKFAMIATVVVIAAVTVFAFAGCNPAETNFGVDYAQSQPNVTPTAQLDSSMSAIEMLRVGMKNYYGADFATAITGGTLVTTVLNMPLTQFVKSITVRDGASDKDGDDVFEGDNNLFYRNLSGTIGGGLGRLISIKIWEETDYTKSGSSEKLYFRNVNADNVDVKTTDNDDGVITDAWFEFAEGKSFEAVQTYNDLTTYVNDKASDPTQIWMYDLKENTILADKTVAPVLNDDGLWEFTISGNVDKTSENYSVAEYEEQMMYMLNSQGQEPTDFYFTDITLKVTMWPNGFFQKVEVSESYVMVLAGIINSEVTLNSTKGFFFEETDDYNAAGFIGTVSNAA